MDPAQKQPETNNSQQVTDNSQPSGANNQPSPAISSSPNLPPFPTPPPPASSSFLTPPPQSPPPPPPPTEIPQSQPTVFSASAHPSHKFPFMIITLIIIIIVIGFALSFVFFNLSSPKKPVAIPLVTPPVTILPSPIPTITGYNNPFASPSATYQNPFASPSATFENPFAQATESANLENQPYKNPFEELK